MRRVDWSKYVDEHYYISRYKLAYEKFISTLLGKSEWEKIEKDFFVTPPDTRRPRGRPRKKRIRAPDEEVVGTLVRRGISVPDVMVGATIEPLAENQSIKWLRHPAQT